MIKPIGDKVIVQKEKNKEKIAHGIVLSQTEEEKTKIARIIAVGPGTEKVKMQVRENQKVIIENHVGIDIKIKEEEYTVIKQENILCVIGGENE